MHLFCSGLQSNTTKHYRSAVHMGFPGGRSVGNAPEMEHLPRGFAIKRPHFVLSHPLGRSTGSSSTSQALCSSPWRSPLWRTSHTRPSFSLSQPRPLGGVPCRLSRSNRVNIRFAPHGVRLIPDHAFLTKNQIMGRFRS